MNRRSLLTGIAALLSSTAVARSLTAPRALTMLGPTAPEPVALFPSTWVNVLDYGADPTGEEPCDVAFTLAVEAVEDGGTVDMPEGDYIFSGSFPLRPGSKKRVTFNGSAGTRLTIPLWKWS